MKIVKRGIIVGSLLLAQIAIAESDSQKEAQKLLDTMGMEEAIVQSMDQMVDVQLQHHPALAPFKSVMMKFIRKHMSWESLKPEFIKIYSEAFSPNELREISEFYASATGRKTIKLMPSLMAQGSQVGAARVQANIGELQEMIKAESERLQKLNAQ